MIRINLAAGGRERGRYPAAGGSTWRATLLPAAACLVALVWAGWQVRALEESAERIASKTLDADAALQALAPAMERLAVLEARRTDLAARAELAAAWREKRFAVAPLLAQIGRSVPDGMRLSELRQEPGAVIVEGRASAVAVVSEFAANLERSDWLAPPVEIIDTQAAGTGVGETVRFSLRAQLSPPAS